MWPELQDAGARRLWVAAGLSVALHAALAVSVQRHPGGGASALTSEPAAPPLIARLVTAVTDPLLPMTTPVVTPPAEPALQNPPAPRPSTAATQPNTAPPGTGSVYYFRSSELDRRPFPLTRVEVPPPESTGILSGVVILRLRISERGRVEDAKIMVGTGAAEFEAAALREFSRARFHPGYRGDLPVRSEMLIEVTLYPPVAALKPQMAGTGSTQTQGK